MPSILDRNWKYIPAASTDISKTIAKARRQLAAQLKAEAEQREAVQEQDRALIGRELLRRVA